MKGRSNDSQRFHDSASSNNTTAKQTVSLVKAQVSHGHFTGGLHVVPLQGLDDSLGTAVVV